MIWFVAFLICISSEIEQLQKFNSCSILHFSNFNTPDLRSIKEIHQEFSAGRHVTDHLPEAGRHVTEDRLLVRSAKTEAKLCHLLANMESFYISREFISWYFVSKVKLMVKEYIMYLLLWGWAQGFWVGILMPGPEHGKSLLIQYPRWVIHNTRIQIGKCPIIMQKTSFPFGATIL